MNDPLSMVPTRSKVLQTLDTMPNIMLEETTTALMVITIPLSLILLAAKLATLMAMMTHLSMMIMMSSCQTLLQTSQQP